MEEPGRCTQTKPAQPGGHRWGGKALSPLQGSRGAVEATRDTQSEGLGSLRPTWDIVYGWTPLVVYSSLGLDLTYPSSTLCPGITFEV
jgi:hypothetical protein